MQVSSGLEDVYIKNTALTFIDGEKGILRYRGYDVNELVEHSTFDEVAYLMLLGELPKREELKSFSSRIQHGYRLPQFVTSIISSLPRDADPLSVYMTALSALSSLERNYTYSKENDVEKSAVILGNAGAITAATFRHMNGQEPVEYSGADNFASAFLQAAFGRKMGQDAVSLMDKALILYIDHEVPASTTAALVACSTLSDMYSSVAAAVAALKGPLHGGAAEAAFRQFQEIGDVGNVEQWFKKNIVEGKRKLMGFGHRVYRTYDPRMLIFKRLAARAINSQEQRKLFDIAQKLEELGVRQFSEKHVYPNTDFYSGIAFSAIGFPVNMFTALFALSRTAGWLAHISEYNETEPRLIRPRAIYNGPGPRKLVPLSGR
ncbi:MAG: citrate synthase [Methanomassiliicoccales archaeon]